MRWVLHVLFWVVVYVFFIYLKKPLLGLSYEETGLVVLKDLVTIGAIFYFLSYVVITQCLLKKRFLLTLLSIILIYYFYATTVYLEFKFISRLIVIPGRGYQAYGQRILSAGYRGILTLQNGAEIALDLTYLLAPALIVKLFVALVKLSRQALKLEMDNLNLELAFLKAQINPHFLFNALNNVYSLALVRSEKTADTVLRLSDLMRYTLYESNASKVPLEKEIRFFRNYVELERIRHSSRVTISFEVEGELDDLVIAPLIIFPFLENAFKHGINSSIASSWVRIDVKVADGKLRVEIKNTRFPNAHAPRTVGGIGIPNTKKRLNLLYPDKHSIHIVGEEDVFLVTLEIGLV
ncbi:sensor histidine kinase [Chryseolinea serpens]|uniref:sensor histidine kinase n=1 Tax=Chryseolinea serpens TaxID=947013 RepID=UPI0015BE2BF1|nr:histidine kinase [Chryseolinea serpens]